MLGVKGNLRCRKTWRVLVWETSSHTCPSPIRKSKTVVDDKFRSANEELQELVEYLGRDISMLLETQKLRGGVEVCCSLSLGSFPQILGCSNPSFKNELNLCVLSNRAFFIILCKLLPPTTTIHFPGSAFIIPITACLEYIICLCPASSD